MRVERGNIIEVMGVQELKENGLYDEAKFIGGRHSYLYLDDSLYMENNFFVVVDAPSEYRIDRGLRDEDIVRVLGDYALNGAPLNVPGVAIKRVVPGDNRESVSVKFRSRLTSSQLAVIKGLSLDWFLDEYQGSEVGAYMGLSNWSNFEGACLALVRNENSILRQVPLFLLEKAYESEVFDYDYTAIQRYLKLFNIN